MARVFPANPQPFGIMQHFIFANATALAALLAFTVPVRELTAATPANWPQFRGPGGSGIAAEGTPPVEFGPKKNVLWQVELPAGHSSPCIWDERIFLTAVVEKNRLETLCLDRKDGRIVWRQAAPVDKLEPTHRIASPAAPTVATDGERVYVYFGSFGLLAYDFAGAEQWRHPLKTPVVEFGASSSPIVAGELVVLLCDADVDSYLLAVDRKTGKTVWKTERAEFRRGFSTPLVWRHDDVEELVVCGSVWLRGYNLKDGKERWSVRGMARVANASPVAGDGLVFVSSWNIGGDQSDRLHLPTYKDFAAANDKNQDGKFSKDEIPSGPFRERFSQFDANKDGLVSREEFEAMEVVFAQSENALFALRPGGQGEITSTHVAWKVSRDLPYISSPLFYQGRVYTMKSGGLFSCYDAKTGKPAYTAERVGAIGDYYSSAVAAGGRIYVASQNGVLVVLEAGDTFKVLARNDLGEKVMSSPAVVAGRIYLRTEKHLYCFGE